MPRSGVVAFVGRDTELNQIHQQLQQGNPVAITAISGMGGIGKTELALQYALAQVEQNTYLGGICWLQARGQLDLGTQIVGFAQVYLSLKVPPEIGDLPQQVAFCWAHWPAGEVLLVLDDVTDYGAIDPYLPPAESRFKVLITTRLQLGNSVQSLAIEVLRLEAALELLMSHIGATRLEAEPDRAREICDWLGYLPLGIELVGCYLKQNQDLPLAELLQRLQQERLRQQALLRPQQDPTWTSSAQRGVADAFELSWQQLTPADHQLAYLLGLFGLAPIAWTWVEQVVNACAALRTSVSWGQKVRQFFSLSRQPRGRFEAWFLLGTATVLETARTNLVRFSLLQRVEPGVYQLHQLVREYFQARLADQIETHACAEELIVGFCDGLVAITHAVPQSPTLKQIQTLAPLIPYWVEIANDLAAWVRDEELIWLYVGLGRFYEGQGAYADALPWYERCVQVIGDRLGENHPHVATSLNNLAGLYDSQGRYAEAEPLFQQALQLRQQVLRPDHPDMATSLNNLAALYDSQGRYAEAEPLFQQALQVSIQALGEAHPDVAIRCSNLAGLYTTLQRYSEAEPLYLHALWVFLDRLSKDHPNTQNAYQGLVNLIEQAIRAGRESELSDDSLVQELIEQMKSGK